MKEGGKEGVKWHVGGRRVGCILADVYVWYLRVCVQFEMSCAHVQSIDLVSSVRVVPLIVYSVEGDYYYHFKLLRATMGL